MQSVSVVIPAYNCQDFIATAVESVLAQNYKDLEVIVVNDGSTDNTKGVLAGFKDKIRVINQPNGGPAGARNTGVLNARSEYVAFLDQDDAWFPEKIERQMELFGNDSGLGLVYSDAYIIDGKSFDKNDHSNLSVFKMRPPCKGSIFAKLFSQNSIATSTVVVRKSCFDKVGLFDPVLTPIEDYDRWLRISFFYKVDFVEKPLVKYRDHVATFRQNPIRALTNTIVTYNKISGDYPEARANLGPVFNRTVSRLHVTLGVRYFFSGDIKNALGNFSSAVKKAKSVPIVFYIFTSLAHDLAYACGRFLKGLLCRMTGKK